jgi:hypothetical protein
LKDFAMCGVGTEQAFNVLVADDDVVERSNLSQIPVPKCGHQKEEGGVCCRCRSRHELRLQSCGQIATR